LLKTNQQKENGRTSPSPDTDLQASSPTLLQSQISTIIEQIEHDSDSSPEQQQQQQQQPAFDLNHHDEIDETYADNNERKVEDYLKTIDPSSSSTVLPRLRRIRSISTTIPIKSYSNLSNRRKSTSNS